MARETDLLVPTDSGLFCAEGGFHVDPWAPVQQAIITHAHADHAASGSGVYYCSPTCALVLRERLAPGSVIKPIPFREAMTLGNTTVSLHPAGHILGSAQVRVEGAASGKAQTWVVSGDYKTAPDRTCEPFEPVACDVFITESTFGLPIYRWVDERIVFEEINAWWRANAAESRTSVVLAYSLGKAQRVLAGIDASIGPIAVHGALPRFCRAYREAGIVLPETPHASGEMLGTIRSEGGLVVAPPSALGSPWIRKFASSPGGMSAAFVSGWMQVRGARRRKAIDRGFVLSDHADWDGLLWAIKATGAKRIGVTHGHVGPLVRWLQEHGTDAFALPTRYQGETGEEAATSDDTEASA